MTEIMQASLFDYSQLDTETRITIKQRAERIQERNRTIALNIWENGRDLYEAQQQLSQHGYGCFIEWAEIETGLSKQMVYNFINVYQKIDCQKFGQSKIAASALYLLAAPSTPEAVRIEAIERAQAGEVITHKIAQGMVSNGKAAELPPNATPIRLHPIPANGARTFVAPYSPSIDLGEYDEMADGGESDDDGYNWQRDDVAYTPPMELPPVVKLPEWTPSQVGRRGRVEEGFSVHANMKTDIALIEWAKQNGLFMRVDRATEWGNPFHLPDDGDRETVINNYEWYLDRKPSLLAKIPMLKGKVLGCWCYPDGCHAEILEERANGEN